MIRAMFIFLAFTILNAVPPNPAEPTTFKSGLLAFVLANDSTLPDTEVYFVITGSDVNSGALQWGELLTPSNGIVSGTPATGGTNSQTFSYSLSQLPFANGVSGNRVLYMPELNSGLIWFSTRTKLNFAGGTQPSYLSTEDPNYTVNYDIMEFSFNKASLNAVNADATAVSFFSIPFYLYLNTSTNGQTNVGLHQQRSAIMSHAASLFNTASGPEKTQWNKLFLTNNGEILRLLSTGKSMSGSMFDPNYLDHEGLYDYSYILNLWSGANSFYRHSPLELSVDVSYPSAATYNYTGMVQSDNTFLFISSNGGPTFSFLAPAKGPNQTDTTSYKIFSALPLTETTPIAGSAEDVITKLFEAGIISGLLPVPSGTVLSQNDLYSHQSSYYTNNPLLNRSNGKEALTAAFDINDLQTFYEAYICQQKDVLYQVRLTPFCSLTTTSSATSNASAVEGLWYDLYSKALHSLGTIYTYGYDETLWNNLLLSGLFIDGTTYLGITIGPVN